MQPYQMFRRTDEEMRERWGGEPTIICDIDGTLALKHDGRDYYDASTSDEDHINPPVDLLLQMAKNFYHIDSYDGKIKIIFVSGRMEKDREPTQRFLNEHGYGECDLYMRKTDDIRSDYIVKKEIYEEHIKDRYQILFVLDDRNSKKCPVVEMWREQGLACFQVAKGDF